MLKRNNKLSISEMIKLENETKKANLVNIINSKDVLNDLSLAIEYVDSSVNKSWDKDTEAILMPSYDGVHNGIIKIQDKYRNSKFAYVHEIVHYVIDVGVGKKVTDTYYRKTTGKTPGKHEQEINYITAASTVPYEEIKERLDKYDNSFPKEDELKMIAELCMKYQQSNKVILRRIKEVRKIEAFKKLSY